MYPEKAYNVWKNEKLYNKNIIRDYSVHANIGAKRPCKGNK